MSISAIVFPPAMVEQRLLATGGRHGHATSQTSSSSLCDNRIRAGSRGITRRR
jgi:hypothetical protein